jgi:hypothetical protein
MTISVNKMIGDEVDRLITLDLNIKLRGVIHYLYNHARELAKGSITLSAAEKLLNIVEVRNSVLIATGFSFFPNVVGETDGPVGAAALARSLRLAFNAEPIIITEDWNIDMVSSTCRGFGLNIVSSSELDKIKNSTAVLGFPVDAGQADIRAKQLIRDFNPVGIISIEKPGLNIKGEYHTLRGLNISDSTAKVDRLFEFAKDEGILTIGIGDAGNELGMGNLNDTVLKHLPYASKCRCHCKSGIADTVVTDISIPSTVSNWGAYGVIAMLALLKNQQNILHTKQIEIRGIRECADSGGFDGETGVCEPSVDGIPDIYHANIVEFLGFLIRKGLEIN